MKQNAIEIIEKPYLKKEITPFKVGDTVRIYQRIKEGEKSRLQAFEGVVVRRRGRGTGETFTLLREERDDIIEKTVPLHSPLLEKIQVIQPGKVGKAKRYHLWKVKKIELSKQ